MNVEFSWGSSSSNKMVTGDRKEEASNTINSNVGARQKCSAEDVLVARVKLCDKSSRGTRKTTSGDSSMLKLGCGKNIC